MTRPDPLQLPETAGDAYHVGFSDGAWSQPRWRRLTVAAVAIAIVAFGLGYLAGQADAAPSSAELLSVPVPTVAAPLSGAPNRRDGEVDGPLAGLRETSPATGAPPDPGTTAPPLDAWTRSGVIAYADESHGPAYLAVPWGPGHLVEVAGPGGTITLVSTDAGPDLAMQRAGRVGDLAVGLWETICAVPRTMGLCPVTISLVARP